MFKSKNNEMSIRYLFATSLKKDYKLCHQCLLCYLDLDKIKINKSWFHIILCLQKSVLE